ncbi:hypothetical protein [Herbaspirillum sp. RV1423]|uniref:hypothetical protein n=1 Tax=Herbaspirillum sp. RV1423 TaxID=1443993 RepID=UPI0005544FAF|nr:hypothetical protein [Herbaspirillum sp. RV1423]
MSVTAIHFHRLVFFSLLASCSAFSFGGTIRFSGAIVESVCTVQAFALDLRTLVGAKSGSPLPLNVYCNANQSVQISVQDMGVTTGRKTFSSGVAGAEVALSHKTSLIGPGDKINYAFSGRKEIIVPLTATLRKAANIDATHMQSSVLVSFDYR